MSKPAKIALLVTALLAVLTVGKAWYDTMRDPAVRQAHFTLQGFEPGSRPIRIALLSDLHVIGPEMPPERLGKIVEQVNSLSPDLVLIAGDFVSDRRLSTQHYGAKQSVAPLENLAAPLGVIAVPGNHDHWRNVRSVRAALESVGVRVLQNSAVQVGPLRIGGLDDAFTDHADLGATLAAMKRLNGAALILSHSPDPFPDLPDQSLLMLAGHTHCGQIRYPWGGSPATMSRYGSKYACGVVRQGSKAIVTSAGLGDSVLPFRFFAPPDIWIIEVGPPTR